MTDVVTTGMVIKKMIKSTNITSTSGVVLMVLSSSSSPSLGPKFMAMIYFLAEPSSTACKSAPNALTSSMADLLRRTNQL